MNTQSTQTRRTWMLRRCQACAAPATWLLAACLLLTLAAAIDAVRGDAQAQVDGPSPTLAALPPSA